MRLADELRGITSLRPAVRAGFVGRRVNYCLDDGREAQIKTEERLRRTRVKVRAWRLANPEKVKAHNVKWRSRNVEKRAAYKRQWRLEHIDHVRKYQARKMREWRAIHPERASAIREAWKSRNRESINARRRVRYAERKAMRAPK